MSPGYTEPVADWNRARLPNLAQMLAIFICSALMVAYLLGANLGATWSIFDDHEIMGFLGPAGHISLAQVWPKLMQTEVSQQSAQPRFRPSYYLLRLLETWAWGKHPALWYASHLIILLFFVVTVWSLGSERIGFWAAGIVTIYMLSFPFWAGIFATLGPGEVYAVLGVGLYLIGARRVWQTAGSVVGWLLILVGSLAAAGSKENFAILLAPTPYLLWRALRGKYIRWPALGLGALAVLWPLWIAWVVQGRLRLAGANVYGAPVGAGSTARNVLHAMINPSVFWLYGGLLALGALWLFWRRRNAVLSRASWQCGLGIVLILGLYVSQVVFYGAGWPDGRRDDFPGMLVWPALLFVLIWYLQRLEESVPAAGRPGNLLVAAALAVGILMIGLNARQFVLMHGASALNVRSTRAFGSFIGSVASIAKSQPEYPVVLESNEPADFEPLTSYARFLVADGVSNAIFLHWIPRRPGVTNYAGSLSLQLTTMSTEGVAGLFQPIGGLNENDNRCILVILSGPGHWPCQYRIQGDWHGF